LVVAADMGYGHLRAADAVARALGTTIASADRPPLAGPEETALWSRTRLIYEGVSRLSQVPLLGAPLRGLLEAATRIPPLHPLRDLSTPTASVRALDAVVRRGTLGRGLVSELERSGAALVTTFFVPALIADHARTGRVYCIVTDTDINRMWVPVASHTTSIRYLAPTMRVVRRLRAYGVPADNIALTGFPLPDELLGGPDLALLRRTLAARLCRLDPAGRFRERFAVDLSQHLGELPAAEAQVPPRLTFAVGGAGAQAELARRFLPALAPLVRQGRLRLTLVAGVRREVAARFERWIDAAGLSGSPAGAVEVLLAADVAGYFRAFNQLLASTDILWTKPSEMTFFAALGLPLLLAPPVGAHEVYNQRWAVEHGAALEQRELAWAGEWIADWLDDGTLAGAAWAGFRRLPNQGLYRILGEVAGRPGEVGFGRKLVDKAGERG
jgi:hypothetical protein